MDIEKTKYTFNNQSTGYPPVQMQQKSSKLPIIFLIGSFIVLAIAVLYYFMVYKAEPKFTINISTDGQIEQKGKNVYDMLYNNTGNIVIEIEASKKPGSTEYFLNVGTEKETLGWENINGKYKYVKKISPKNNTNSQFQVSLVSGKGVQLLNETMSVNILRPIMSAREFIENYLRTFSEAYTAKSYARLSAAKSYCADGVPDMIAPKLQVGFPDKSYYSFDNVISTPNDEVTARVSIFRFNDYGSTDFLYFYKFTLKVVKGESGLPEWKISNFNEVLEKKNVFNYNEIGD